MERLTSAGARLARRIGISISRYPPYLSLEHHLRELIRDAEIELVIDIGAHHGEFRDVLRHECAYKGRIISFEPASEAYRRLELIADPKWERYKYALGRSDGEGTLHLFGETVFNSMLTPNESALGLFDLSRQGSERTTVRRLDAALSEIGVDLSAQPSFIKIDTQGGDREVIAGGPIAVAAARLLQTEMPLLRIYDGAPAFLGCLEEVLQLGFDVTGVFPVTRDKDYRVIEVDCVLRRVASGDGHLESR